MSLITNNNLEDYRLLLFEKIADTETSARSTFRYAPIPMSPLMAQMGILQGRKKKVDQAINIKRILLIWSLMGLRGITMMRVVMLECP